MYAFSCLYFDLETRRELCSYLLARQVDVDQLFLFWGARSEHVNDFSGAFPNFFFFKNAEEELG